MPQRWWAKCRVSPVSKFSSGDGISPTLSGLLASKNVLDGVSNLVQLSLSLHFSMDALPIVNASYTGYVNVIDVDLE
jgi:hypothetical protein